MAAPAACSDSLFALFGRKDRVNGRQLRKKSNAVSVEGLSLPERPKRRSEQASMAARIELTNRLRCRVGKWLREPPQIERHLTRRPVHSNHLQLQNAGKVPALGPCEPQHADCGG